VEHGLLAGIIKINKMVYTLLRHAHSVNRWFLLIFLLLSLILAVVKMESKKEYSKVDQLSSMLTMSVTHLQLLLGIVLYFISGKVVFSAESFKNDLLRFFLVEHVGLMVVAIALITIGYSKIKKAVDSKMKRKRTLIYYGIALIIILLALPWPWQKLSAGWI